MLSMFIVTTLPSRKEHLLLCQKTSTILSVVQSFLPLKSSAWLATNLQLWSYFLRTTFIISGIQGLFLAMMDNPFFKIVIHQCHVINYGNYIVARPISNSWHSEEEIFGSSINSHFYELWTAYVRHNHSPPKCVLLYTWNLPCSRCTDVIIRSLNDSMYRCTSVIVAHTIYWRSESEDKHRKNIQKLRQENITVEQVPYPKRLSPALSTHNSHKWHCWLALKWYFTSIFYILVQHFFSKMLSYVYMYTLFWNETKHQCFMSKVTTFSKFWYL